MAPPKLESILTSIEHGIGIIKYNRPNNGNAVSAAVGKELLQAFKWALEETEVKVIVYSGEGKFFTAGMDLMAASRDGPVISDEMIETLRETHKTLINASKVMIAAVNGPAVGYGTSSVALFDLVYSVPDAIFFTPFVKVGVCAEACSSVTLMKIMGRQKAAALLLAGERMTPQELESAGLVTKILPKEGFFEEVMKIAQRVAAQPPGALEFNKNLMVGPIREELLAANERECEGLRERCKTDEPHEALKAFEREQKERKKATL